MLERPRVIKKSAPILSMIYTILTTEKMHGANLCQSSLKQTFSGSFEALVHVVGVLDDIIRPINIDCHRYPAMKWAARASVTDYCRLHSANLPNNTVCFSLTSCLSPCECMCVCVCDAHTV